MPLLPVGTIVAERYALIRVLGEGAMGSVYEAQNTWTDRRVALKLLHPDHAKREDLVARFMQEARIATRIAHENIVEVLDMGRDPASGALYIVQELLRGVDLRGWLTQNRRALPTQALELVAPVAAALAAAHARGVVHRDVKPENIFLAESGGSYVPKLIDFGVSKVIAPDAHGMYRTAFGQVIGTPEYMAPEQLLGSPELDGRVDVWAVGVVLYELLTGQSPFEDSSVNAVVARVMAGSPAPVQSLVPELSTEVARLVHGAIEPRLDRRIPTAQALLERVLETYSSLTATRRLNPELLLTARRKPSEPRPAPVLDAARVVEPSRSAPVPQAGDRFDEDLQETSVFIDLPPEHPSREEPVAQRAAGVSRRSVRVVGEEAAGESEALDEDITERSTKDTFAESAPSWSQPSQSAAPIHEDSVLYVEALLAEGKLADVVRGAEALIAAAEAGESELLGRLRAAEGAAYRWLGDAAQAVWCGSEALRMLPAGSGRWLNALGEAALGYGARGDSDALVALASELRAALPSGAPPQAPLAIAVMRLSTQLTIAGWPEVAWQLVGELQRSAPPTVLAHPLVRAWMLRAEVLRARGEYRLEAAAGLAAQAVVAFEESSDLREACASRAELGELRRALGDYPGAERVLRMAIEQARALGIDLEHVALVTLATVRARAGEAVLARTLAERAAGTLAQLGNRRAAALAQLALAEALLQLGDPSASEAVLRGLVGWAALAPNVRILARARRALALGEQGLWDDALDSAERALDQLQQVGTVDDGESLVHLAYVRALFGSRHRRAAKGALHDALALLDERSAKLVDPALRHAFVENVPEHRGLRSLRAAIERSAQGG